MESEALENYFALKLPRIRNGEKTVAELLILILARDWPLSIRGLHYRITKQHAATVSFQGVHKAAKRLLEEKVLEKEQSLYMLNREWLGKLRKFSEETGKTYSWQTTQASEQSPPQKCPVGEDQGELGK